MFRFQQRIPIFLLAALATTAPAHADPAYTVRSLGDLGSWVTHPTGLNNAGEAVGYALDEQRHSYVFLSRDGVMTAVAPGSEWMQVDINDAGTIMSSNGQVTNLYVNGAVTTLDRYFHGWAINDRGQVVGDYGRGIASGAIYTPGQPMRLFGDGYYVTTGYAINDSGMVAGTIHGWRAGDPEDFPTWRPMTYINDVLRMVDSPNGFGIASAINDSGVAVGFTSAGAAMWNPDGSLINLGALFEPNTPSWATGINNFGEVVGSFTPGNMGRQHGFLYSNGTMYDLDTLLGPDAEFEIGSAVDINDQHQILAETPVEYDTPQSHGLLLTPGQMSPVPEPQQWTLLLLGLLLLARAAHRVLEL